MTARTHDQSEKASARPGDAPALSWVDKAPAALIPYLRLSRWDRPAGFWLLGLPCAIGLAFAGLERQLTTDALSLLALFAVGAIAMRGAGCTYNDILDRDIDAKVERTAGRPLASGAVSTRAAWLWLLAQCGAGLAVLLMLPTFAQLVALASVPLVALYPLMKRITWWPQAWLGLTFTWGFPVAVAAWRGHFTAADAIAYLALVFWTIGYDTLYAVQDIEDDALVGVRSTARLFGDRVRQAMFVLYGVSAGLAATAGWIAAEAQGMFAALPFAGHLLLQAYLARPGDGARALLLFKSNREAALMLALAWAGVALFLTSPG